MNESFDHQPVKPQHLIICLIVILSLIVAGGFIIFWLAYRHGQGMGLQALKNLQAPREAVLPLKYRIPLDAILSDWEYDNYTSQWAYAFSTILASQYKKYGIDNKLQNSFEYISFSLDSIQSFMLQFCETHSKLRICSFPSDNRAEDIYDWIVYRSDILSSLYPIAQCEKTLKCDSISNSPIHFTPGIIKRTTGIRSAKQLLLETSRSLAFTFPIPYLRYWFECPSDSSMIVCNSKLYRCPHNLSLYCYPKDFSMLETDSVLEPGNEISLGPTITGVFVGYNDNFLQKRSRHPNQQKRTHFQSDKVGKGYLSYNSLDEETERRKGGFIVRNGLGIRGHTLEYLLGEISQDMERSICPNDLDPREWTPVDSACAVSHGSISKCDNNRLRILGSEAKNGPTILRCISSEHCRKDAEYAVAAESTTRLPNGMIVGDLVEYVASRTPKVKIVRADWTPFANLYEYLEPVNPSNVDSRLCGHLFLSYDLMEKIQAAETLTSGAWKITDFPVSFSKGSYPTIRNGEYSYFIPSARDFKMLNLSVPFDVLEF